MAFTLGLIIGAVGVFALIMLIGSVEWETTYTVEKDKDEDKG